MPIYKTGLDYYSHDIGMTKDSKLRKVRKNFGSVGIDVWLAVLDLIYSDKGYYINYGTEDEKDSVVWAVLDYVKGKYAPNAQTVEEIIEALVACGLFSGDLAKCGILSSLRIQQQYYLATVERKAVEIIPEYWLIDLEKMKKLSGKSSILRQFDNRSIIDDNQPIIDNNQPISKESKVKESKVKESKVVVGASAPTTTTHTTTYGKQVRLTEKDYAELVEKYGKEVIEKYIKKIDRYLKSKNIEPFENHSDPIREWLEKDGIHPKEKHSYDLDKLLEHAISDIPKIKGSD